MNKIYIITGLMASGKSTIGQLLAQALPKAVHLRGDSFRKMIVTGRVEMSTNSSTEAFLQLDLRYKLTALCAKEYYANGFNVVVQDNYLGEKLHSFLLYFTDIPYQLIVLNPNLETIEEREKSRKKTGYIGFTPKEIYTIFQQETPKIGKWIDNSFLTPEETVAHILSENP